MARPSTAPPAGSARGPSPAARNLGEWFRQLERLIRTSRTYGIDNDLVVRTRARLLEAFAELLEFHAPLPLRVTPLEIWLRDEPVVRPSREGEGELGVDRRLPFLLYRDGVRGITFARETSAADVETLVDSLMRMASGSATHEDLVTLLWERGLDGLRVEVAPLEQTLVPGETPAPQATAGESAGAGAAEASPIMHVALDDWPVPDATADPVQCWDALQPSEPEHLADWNALLARAHARPWTEEVPALVHEVLASDASAAMRAALASSLVTWLASAIERCEWSEAWRAFECLREVDPDGSASDASLASVLSGVDSAAIAERLDEAAPESLGRFFALTVQLDRPALDLVVGILGHAGRPRLRAAATTALSYTCADDPLPLARYLADSRWHVVRNVVFVLGQIGGAASADLLAAASRHLDARVRRAVIHALGQVPAERRVPMLLGQLDSTDGQMLSAVLGMLTREPDPRVTNALLERIGAIDFETRPDELKLPLLTALGDIAGDEAVPTLEAMLHKGGWFARRTSERAAVANTLARIGTPTAHGILETGTRSRAEAVRAACLEALGRQERAA